jgi:hypothetical protein
MGTAYCSNRSAYHNPMQADATEPEGALGAGLQACLVRTGKYQPGDEERCALPGLQLALDVDDIVGTLMDRQ